MNHIQRIEKKYLVTNDQALKLYGALREYMCEDQYGPSKICNIYYDTPDFRLIRHSIEKPEYKEKVRLRSYGVPECDDVVFAELKKKCGNTVYKRRIDLPLQQAKALLRGEAVAHENTQVAGELLWTVNHYQNLQPKMAINYERLALFGIEDAGLRITFDAGICWRTTQLDLAAGSFGHSLMGENWMVLEIKASRSMPIWLVKILSEEEIYPTSFSKYGNCYKQLRRPTITIGGYSYVGQNI